MNRLEDPSLVELDHQMFREAQSSYANLFFSNPYLGELWDHSIGKEEQGIVTELALHIYYIKKYQELKPEIQKQLKLCKVFLASDICWRNVEFEVHLKNEIKILEAVLNFKAISHLVNLLNLTIKAILPHEKKNERYIRISEVMHSLNIYDKKPFLSLEMSVIESIQIELSCSFHDITPIIFDKYKAQGKIKIFDRIKKEINENLCLKY